MNDHFKEIVGYEDIKKELRVISDMLNNPEMYRSMGVHTNNGLMLYGAPGTGKTTMANCLIKSTNRKAYVCRKKASDGEFVKQIVDMFDLAKINAPSIVLLDDLDKFSDEEDDRDAEEFVAVQACIDEMQDKDVFVIATVNNHRKIPRSLVRPGRLGKRIYVRIPKDKEAVEIIKYYLSRIKNCEALDEVSIARMLDDESCATLENVISCAAMKAAFNRQEKVTMENIVEACLDLVFEAPECANRLSEEALRKIAYHEAGHALAAELLDPKSVSIISIRETEGGDYGFVRYFRPDEKEDLSVEYNLNIIKTSLAGKAAIDIVYGVPEKGAESDISNAFKRAHTLIEDECMNDFNCWTPDDHDAFTAENRNRAIAELLDRSYQDVKRLLIEHRELLDKIVDALMEKTTLIYSDVQELFTCSYNGDRE